MNKKLIFIELNSFKELILSISITPGMYLNYLKIGGKYIYFNMVSIGNDFRKVFFYCMLNEKIPYNWINFNPRNLDIKIVKKPINSPNYNISIINCKKINFLDQVADFINS